MKRALKQFKETAETYPTLFKQLVHINSQISYEDATDCLMRMCQIADSGLKLPAESEAHKAAADITVLLSMVFRIAKEGENPSTLRGILEKVVDLPDVSVMIAHQNDGHHVMFEYDQGEIFSSPAMTLDEAVTLANHILITLGVLRGTEYQPITVDKCSEPIELGQSN